ncbi:hypothetical protein PanWU01x14_342750 [Parasponia andersonii]|uniref:Uncharacterized protein n=1 Tax=Parasponia andersonii TaxID=3476 RepID=A0A2P5ADP5_PARAD|nr:hypothetical protein PanWU01x14_342750 [Parasponia andersonii]
MCRGEGRGLGLRYAQVLYTACSIQTWETTQAKMSTKKISTTSYAFSHLTSKTTSDFTKPPSVKTWKGSTSIGLCRRDSNTSCMLLTNCPKWNEAILCGEFCMVLYSNNFVFSIKEDEPIKCWVTCITKYMGHMIL